MSVVLQADIKLTTPLTDEQDPAVRAADGPVLVVAGPGTGKTRVLSSRIEYLIRAKGVDPERIFCCAFTNKAADEIKERIKAGVGDAVDRIWAGTLHSLCVRLLRTYAPKAGYPTWFSIYDQHASEVLMTQVLRDLSAVGAKPKDALQKVHDYKSKVQKPAAGDGDWAKIYDEYQSRLFKAKAMDFDDLILVTYKIVSSFADVQRQVQAMFDHILVDEFQDISPLQGKLLELLAGRTNNLYVVGDEMQSIYSFNGADVEWIRTFSQRLPGAQVHRLTRNFRSLPAIVEISNALAGSERIRPMTAGKAKIQVTAYRDEGEEAEAVADLIKAMHKSGEALSEIAVLYRAGHMSGELELALLERGVPYRVVKGHTFMNRREIQDILSFLRLRTNPHDLVSLRRAIGIPCRRGIGEASLLHIADLASKHNVSLLDVMAQRNGITLPGRIAEAAKDFAMTVEKLFKPDDRPSKAIYSCMASLDFATYLSENLPEAESWDRMKSLETLVSLAERFEASHRNATVHEFLQWLMLRRDSDDEEAKERVNLMTLHASKGLEFKNVFMIGCCEEMIPHWLAVKDGPEAIEEEKRLFYVGITRSKQRLFLSYPRAYVRRARGSVSPMKSSRFLDMLGLEKANK